MQRGNASSASLRGKATFFRSFIRTKVVPEIPALLNMGKGWHNNHHHCVSSVRQGFFWWEIDLTYYILKMLSWVHIVWDLKMPPPAMLHPVPAES